MRSPLAPAALASLLAFGLAALGLGGCGPGDDDGGEPSDATGSAATLACGFTPDFAAFVARAPYAGYDFARRDLEGCSSYGGRARPGEALRRDPVVFVHGNSDRGLGGELDGWAEPLAAFRAAGYEARELYTFTWGDGRAAAAPLQYHSRENLGRVRAFLEAVLAYTGARHVDVVGHSMGVTLARKAILGGAASDALDGGAYDLGPSLGARVDTFVGIAGGNRGLTSCWFSGPSTPTCGATNGFFPGTATPFGVVGRSRLLDDLLARPHAEAGHVYSVWSSGDPLAGRGAALVWGEVTARLPGQDGEIELDASYGHLGAKSRTGRALVRLVAEHALP